MNIYKYYYFIYLIILYYINSNIWFLWGQGLLRHRVRYIYISDTTQVPYKTNNVSKAMGVINKSVNQLASYIDVC